MRCLICFTFLAATLALAEGPAADRSAAPVAALTYSPDGRLLAAAGRGVVHLIDAGSGDVIDELPRLEAKVTALAFAPEGQRLAVAAGVPGQAGVIHLFQREGAGWKKTRTLGEAKDLLHALAWRPDGKELLAAGYERVIRVWEPSQGKLLRTLMDHSDSVNALAWRADGQLFASAAADRTVKVWNAEGKRLYTLSQATDWLYALAWSPDGQTLAAGGVDKSLRLFRVTPTEGELKQTVFAHGGAVQRLAFTPDGKELLSLGEDRLLKVWDSAPLKEKRSMPALPETGLALAVSPRGDRFAVGRFDGAVTIHDLQSGAALSQPLPNRFPLVRFDEAAAVGEGQPIPAPATVVGALPRAGAELRFKLTLGAGQELGVQAAKAEGSPLDPALKLADAKGDVAALGRGGLLGFQAREGGAFELVLRDELWRGGKEFGFRLKLGPLPIVTAHFPLGIRRGSEANIHLSGVHLGRRELKVRAPADSGARLKLDLKTPYGPALNPPSLAVGEVPELQSQDSAGPPLELPIPGSGNGCVHEGRATVGQSWTFQARRGQRLLIEVHARRLGSPLDSVLEIQDAKGNPLPRAVLRSTATAYTTLRDHDAAVAGIRFEAMDGFAMGDFVWLGGELLKIDEMPRNPDDDCRFHAKGGRRLGWLGTTPRHHALGTAAYRVEVHPPGTAFPPGGLPTFSLNFENDDGGPGFGKDSYLVFDPPADGAFKLCVRDALGRGGPDFAYRVTVRPPRPDFKINVDPKKLAVPPGEGQALYLSAERIDEFDGRIQIEAKELPPGWSCPPTFIGEGVAATAVVLVREKLPASAWWGWEPRPKAGERARPRLTCRATIGGKEVIHETPLPPLETGKPGDLAASTVEREVTLAPGGTAKVTVKIARRNKFDKRVPVEVRGLPYGVRVEDVGLNGVLITPEVSERTFTLYAEPWVRPQEKPLAVIAKREGGGEAAAPSPMLRIVAPRN